MSNNLIRNIRVHMPKTKERVGYVLLHLAKTGKINATTTDLDMTNYYVYKAYKPILDHWEVTEDVFLSNAKQTAKYRNEYAEFIRGMIRTGQQDAIGREGKINIDTATTALLKRNTDWLELSEILHQKDADSQTRKKIQENVNYSGFILQTDENRGRLLRIAKDKNRSLDKEIFNNLKEYILKSEDISAEEYMDNQELRDKYRAIYQGLINELEKDGAKGKLSFETTKEAIQRIVSSAGSILMYQEFTQGEVELPEVPELLQLATLSPTELYNTTLIYSNGFQQKLDQDSAAAREKQLQEIRFLDDLNRKHHKAMNEMFQEFAQAELARAQAGLREFAELKERYDAESSSSRQTKK